MQPVQRKGLWPKGFLALVLVLLLAGPAGAMAGNNASSASVEYNVPGLGPGAPFSAPLGIYYDAARDECYVADTGNHQVVVCDGNGIPVYHFQYPVNRDGEPAEGEPRSLAVDDRGRVFVVDNRVPELSVLDPKGRVLGTIAAPRDDCGKPHGFDHVARGPGNLIYASISCSPRLVAVINGALEIARVIRLDAPGGKQACITGLAVGSSGDVYITDACAKQMVQVFNSEGGFIRGFGKHNNGFKNFSFAAGIAVMDNGDMWVADAIRGTVSRFSAEGEFISYVQGDGETALTYPSGISTDGSSRLFVLEQGGNRFQCFELTGPSQAAGGAQP